MNAAKKSALVEVGRAGLPAVVKAGRRWKTLDQLASDADHLMSVRKRVFEMIDTIGRTDVASKPRGDLEDLLSDIEEWPEDDDELVDQVAKCRAAFAQLDPADHYNEDGELMEAPVIKRLVTYVGSFPASTAPNAEPYVRALLEHVMSVEDLQYLALDDACRRVVEQSKKGFDNGPGVLVEAIMGCNDQWAARRRNVDGGLVLEDQRRLWKRIADFRPKLEHAMRERAIRDASWQYNSALQGRRRALGDVTRMQTTAAEAAKAVQAAFDRLAHADAGVAEKAEALSKAVQEAATKPD